jgi:hypothetical protein
MRGEHFSHVLLITLCLSAPAFAYTASGVDDAANPGADNPGLDVTRHAMPPPDVTAKPAEASTVAANPLWAIPLSALTATRTRPLFTPSRHPPAPIVASVPVAAPRPPPVVPQHPNLTLVGTVAGENEGVAVFIGTTTRDTLRLRPGEGHRVGFCNRSNAARQHCKRATRPKRWHCRGPQRFRRRLPSSAPCRHHRHHRHRQRRKLARALRRLCHSRRAACPSRWVVNS